MNKSKLGIIVNKPMGQGRVLPPIPYLEENYKYIIISKNTSDIDKPALLCILIILCCWVLVFNYLCF